MSGLITLTPADLLDGSSSESEKGNPDEAVDSDGGDTEGPAMTESEENGGKPVINEVDDESTNTTGNDNAASKICSAVLLC